jgi:hypothetical protein
MALRRIGSRRPREAEVRDINHSRHVWSLPTDPSLAVPLCSFVAEERIQGTILSINSEPAKSNSKSTDGDYFHTPVNALITLPQLNTIRFAREDSANCSCCVALKNCLHTRVSSCNEKE